jgi:MFS family permease
VILCAFQSVGGTIFAVFGLAFATSAEVGISRPTMLWAAVVANVVALFMQPSLAVLADRIGRKPVFISGVVGLALSIFLYFWAISTANVVLIFAGAIVFTGICYSAPNAIFPSFYAEMFNTKVRFSGMALGTQIGFAFAGFAPTIAWTIVGDSRTNWIPVAILVAVACLISAAAASTARETYKTPLAQLGKPIA